MIQDNSEENVGQDEKAADEKLVALAREQFNLCVEAYDEHRRVALEDKLFRAGEQWPDEVRTAREQDRRPCLTVNRIPQFIRQVTNDQRQNRPAIKVSPVDDKADIETAKILTGIIRHIEYSSHADTAYDTAFESAASTGLGYFRIITAFESPTSFNQEIKIKRVRDENSVYLDPFSKEPDGSDAEFGFVFEDMDEKEFKKRYPNTEAARMEDWASASEKVDNWVSKDRVRLAEYFYREHVDDTLLLLADGMVVLQSQAQGLPLQVVEKRPTQTIKVHWLKINGIEVLERTIFPGSHFPIIPVYGDEIVIEGKRILEGVIRHAKDSQRMYNYFVSSEAEAIALAPKAPFIGPAGSFKGFEREWKEANIKNHAFLQYNPKSLDGATPLPPPQRNAFEAPVQAITSARMQAADDIKATTGIYDAALGQKSNESSGVAIQRRAHQAQTANYHFIDNLSRSLRHAGRILVEIIPVIYDTARAMNILGEDGEQELIHLNEVFKHKGEEKLIDLSLGKYDVTVRTGPSFTTKRQEAVEAMLEFVKAYPPAAQVIGDLMAKNMDWPGSQEIAERLKKIMPPGVIEDKEQKPLPPEVQAQLGQLQQMNEQLTQELNNRVQQAENKTLELESKERIEMAKLQFAAQSKLADLGSKEAIFMLQQEIAQIDRRLALLGEGQAFEHEGSAGIAPGAPPEMGDQFSEVQSEQPMDPNQFPTGGPSPGQFLE